MLKRMARITGIALLALLMAIGGFWGLSVGTARSVTETDHIGYPTLTAVITSPADGTVFRPGECFDVVATISATCPVCGLIQDEGQLDGWPLVKPVFAGGCETAAWNVQASISITGNAEVEGEATKDVADTLDCPEGPCVSEATVSWEVCCTAEGEVNIEVTPYGELPCAVYSIEPNPFVSAVHATTTYCPLPDDHLISDSITIYQKEPEPKPFEEQSSWSLPPNYTWPRPADTKVLTASVEPSQVAAGEPVKIMANVANRGELSGSYTAQLSINGQVADSRQLTVPGNNALPIEFTVVREEPGTYEVDINGQKAYFTVVGEQGGMNPTTVVYIVLGALIVLALVLGSVFVLRRGSAR